MSVVIHHDGKPVVVGDLFFYTERPASDYADTVERAYLDASGVMRFEALVLRTGEGGAFVAHHRDPANDMSVADSFRYSSPNDGTRLNVDASLITPEWADAQYPPGNCELQRSAPSPYDGVHLELQESQQ